MFIKYVGGRSSYKVSPNRKPYIFNKENNFTLEIKDQSIINYIFSLANNSEFQAVEAPAQKQEQTKDIEPKKFSYSKKGDK